MYWAQTMEILAPLLATLLVTLISWGVYELKKYVKSKTDNQLFINAVDSIGEAAESSVHDIKVMVDEMKADGKFTKEEAEAVKAEALARTKAILSEQTIKVAAKTIADLDSYIAGKIEKEVAATKG
jgi:hypothetical protein